VSEPHPFRIEIIEPDACTPEQQAQFHTLVLEGGEVDEHGLPALIERAAALAFVHHGDSVVGVGAMKRPNASYRKTVFAKAQSSLTARDFEFELGWLYLTPAARGNRLTTPVITGLLQRAKRLPVYATSRVDNTRMHASLERCSFRKEGTPYPSKQRDTDLHLFVLARTLVDMVCGQPRPFDIDL
jgi:hypothetical protein